MPARRIAVFLAMTLVLVGTDFAARLGASSSDYVCGDGNVGDAVSIINYVFKGGPAPNPIGAADANGDTQINVGDAVWIVNYVFRGGPKPDCQSGALVSHSQCKSHLKGLAADSVSPTQDCLAYRYDGVSLLSLKHINAAFNCCPTRITADIMRTSGVITIVEHEEFEGSLACPCLCLYDVDYRFIDLTPAAYTIKVVGVYLGGGAPLEFTIDLSSLGADTLCVERSGYPWGGK